MTTTEIATLIQAHLAEFLLGVTEANDSVGMTYDDDPDSPRSTAYDMGRTLGEHYTNPSPSPRDASFIEWVSKHILDGDEVIGTDDGEYEYLVENDEAYDNYSTIVTEARRLAGKESA